MKNPEQFFERLHQQLPGESDIMTIAQHYEQKGMQQGMQEGYDKGRLAVARTMLSDHAEVEAVVRYTHLSLDEVNKLQEELNNE